MAATRTSRLRSLSRSSIRRVVMSMSMSAFLVAAGAVTLGRVVETSTGRVVVGVLSTLTQFVRRGILGVVEAFELHLDLSAHDVGEGHPAVAVEHEDGCAVLCHHVREAALRTAAVGQPERHQTDRKSTRLNSSHVK